MGEKRDSREDVREDIREDVQAAPYSRDAGGLAVTGIRPHGVPGIGATPDGACPVRPLGRGVAAGWGACRHAGQATSRTRGGVPLDGESAAPLRTARPERGDDDVPARRERGQQDLPVPRPVGRVREEVEDGPVVPEVPRVRALERQHVGHEPFHTGGPLAEPGPRHLQGLRGDVEHADPVAVEKQGVDEPGRAAPNIEDTRRRPETGRPDHLEGRGGGLLEPTHLVLPLRPVDAAPVVVGARCRVQARVRHGVSGL